MGFVKTPEEVDRLRTALRTTRFVEGEMLSVTFRTEAAAITRVLAPGLEPDTEPLARVTVSRWRSKSVGDFVGGGLYVAAQRDGVVAQYAVTMFMDKDVPLLFGRELYGEPKKIARIDLDHEGDRTAGWIERGGVRVVEIDATLGADTGPATETGNTFNVKASLSPDGQGLSADAQITLATFATVIRSNRPLSGIGVHLRSTPHDPLGELPVLEVVSGSYAEGDMSATCGVLGSIPADDFFPYALGRLDDYTDASLDTGVC